MDADAYHKPFDDIEPDELLNRKKQKTMALRFVIQEVNIEAVKKPGQAKGYEKATVVHTYNGRSQTQNIMSFANPQVFATVKHLKAGNVIDVDITKNDAGYNQWAKVTQVHGEEVEQQEASPPIASASMPRTTTSGKVVGSNYETREERAARQVLIVRQSCLAQAQANLGQGSDPEAVKALAQNFTNWVFEKPDLFAQPNNDVDGEAS